MAVAPVERRADIDTGGTRGVDEAIVRDIVDEGGTMVFGGREEELTDRLTATNRPLSR